MKFKLLFCLLFISSLTTLVSCSNDDDSAADDTFQFVDKWWYSPDHSTLDVYFDSDGTYESVYLFGGMTIPSNGEWEWVDESAKIFRVYNLTGNATSQFYGKVSEVTANTAKIKISFDQGETFSDDYSYVDVNE